MATVFLLFRDLVNLKHLGYTFSHLQLGLALPHGPFIHLFAVLRRSRFVIPLHDLPTHCRTHDTGTKTSFTGGRLGCRYPNCGLRYCSVFCHHVASASTIVSHTYRKKEFKGFEITAHSVKTKL